MAMRTCDNSKLIKAKYQGRCSCGIRIAVGDLIYYDPSILKKALCLRCGNRMTKLLADAKSVSELQEIVEGFKGK